MEEEAYTKEEEEFIREEEEETMSHTQIDGCFKIIINNLDSDRISNKNHINILYFILYRN